jgi:hypothetical protein
METLISMATEFRHSLAPTRWLLLLGLLASWTLLRKVLF